MQYNPTRWGFSIYLGRGIEISVCLFHSAALKIHNIAPLISTMEKILWSGRISHSFYIWQPSLCKKFPFYHSLLNSHAAVFSFFPVSDTRYLAGDFSKLIWMKKKKNRRCSSELKIPWHRRIFRLTGSSKYSFFY